MNHTTHSPCLYITGRFVIAYAVLSLLSLMIAGGGLALCYPFSLASYVALGAFTARETGRQGVARSRYAREATKAAALYVLATALILAFVNSLSDLGLLATLAYAFVLPFDLALALGLSSVGAFAYGALESRRSADMKAVAVVIGDAGSTFAFSQGPDAPVRFYGVDGTYLLPALTVRDGVLALPPQLFEDPFAHFGISPQTLDRMTVATPPAWAIDGRSDALRRALDDAYGATAVQCTTTPVLAVRQALLQNLYPRDKAQFVVVGMQDGDAEQWAAVGIRPDTDELRLLETVETVNAEAASSDRAVSELLARHPSAGILLAGTGAEITGLAQRLRGSCLGRRATTLGSAANISPFLTAALGSNRTHAVGALPLPGPSREPGRGTFPQIPKPDDAPAKTSPRARLAFAVELAAGLCLFWGVGWVVFSRHAGLFALLTLAGWASAFVALVVALALSGSPAPFLTWSLLCLIAWILIPLLSALALVRHMKRAP